METNVQGYATRPRYTANNFQQASNAYLPGSLLLITTLVFTAFPGSLLSFLNPSHRDVLLGGLTGGTLFLPLVSAERWMGMCIWERVLLEQTS